jgi:MoxR-like ATPase
MNYNGHFLRKLGVYGFDQFEPIVLASLVSGDPLLLIGKAGTGKTYLLNSISEALGLEHRHYNASFISFDDLIGFPFPDNDHSEVRYLKSPATIWEAESVLIDEISRCKPEIQNKFFSLIHERKIQGIPLEKLQYRWAAMNPLLSETDIDEDQYDGSISLDQALADRFAFIINVPDWEDLSAEDQNLVIHPSGEGAVNSKSDALSHFIQMLKPEFSLAMENPPEEVINYCRIIATLLTESGYRISPRRARLLARNLIALQLVSKKQGYPQDDKSKSNLFKLCTCWSIPQRAWKGHIPEHIIDLAHSECMRQIAHSDPKDRWLQEFLRTDSLKRKTSMLVEESMAKEVKSIALIQFLHNGSPLDTSVFAFATQPLIQSLEIVDDEALAELTKKATSVLHIDGEMKWRALNHRTNSVHPQWSECVNYLSKLGENDGGRRRRAKQLFLYLIINDEFARKPEYVESKLHQLFTHVRHLASVHLDDKNEPVEAIKSETNEHQQH